MTSRGVRLFLWALAASMTWGIGCTSEPGGEETKDQNKDNDNGAPSIEEPVEGVWATEGDGSKTIEIGWEAVDGADAYEVFRDGESRAEVDGDRAEYVDDEPDPPQQPQAPYDVEATDDDADGVRISWSFDDPEPGDEHEYTVRAVVDGETTPESDPATARVSPHPVAFEVRGQSDDQWREVGPETEYLDTDAPYGEIETPGRTRATKGVFVDKVQLSIRDLETTPGPEQSYEVRVVDDVHDPQNASPVVGRRGAAHPYVTWERSTGDEPDEFMEVSGADTAPYADGEAPSHGAIRYWRAELSFPEDEPMLTEKDWGFRAIECGVDEQFDGEFGTWDGEDSPVTLGGDSPDEDANLDTLWDATASAWNDDDPQKLEPPVFVEDAVVVATSFRENQQFWLRDRDETMHVFLDEPLGVDIDVGDEVSFEATEMAVFNGVPEVHSLQAFSVDGAVDAVPFLDVRTEAIDIDELNQLVRVGGVLKDGQPCGDGYTCYELEYGPYNGRQSVPFRTSSDEAADNGCVTFVGPVGAFPGPKSPMGEDPAPQLQTDYFRWTRFL